MSATRIILLIFGLIGLLISIGLFLGGGTLLWASSVDRDSEGFYFTDHLQIEKDSYAIFIGPADIDIQAGWERGWGWDLGDLVTFKVEGTSNEPSKQIFMGIAEESDTDSYLAGVEKDEITDLNIFTNRVDYMHHAGSTIPEAPTSQNFWTESVYGSGTQVLEWELEAGSYSLIFMNEDGTSGIDIVVAVGAKVPLLVGISIGLIIGGVFALSISILMIYFAARRPRAMTPETTYTPTPIEDKGEVKANDTGATSAEMTQQQKDDEKYLEIAKERYAKGEISKEELEQIKRDLS